jgi:hypothetical protein
LIIEYSSILDGQLLHIAVLERITCGTVVVVTMNEKRVITPGTDKIEEITQRIMAELETASSRDLSDDHYAKRILQLSNIHYTKGILQEIESSSSGAECIIEKRALIEALLHSTWSQRLYFIIRAFIMGLIGTAITLGFVSYFGTINVTLAIIMGMIIFISALAISRLFDAQIVKVTKSIIRRLDRHRTVRDFIMDHF